MTQEKKLHMKPVADGIYVIDSLYLDLEEMASCYLLEDDGELAFVETNTNYAVPLLLKGVTELGFSLDQVKYVILTHIHLDHAGGAGLLMERLPNAKLVVHPRGRKHMINPEKLIEGVKHVYGEAKYKELYGEIRPIPKDRLRVADVKGTQTDSITLGKRTLELVDAPGHAKHHMFIFDTATRSVFSGDSFGIAYPLFHMNHSRLAFPSTSPVQFEPDRALETYEKIVSRDPARILFTHFGGHEDIDRIHQQLKQWIAFSVQIAENRYTEGLRDQELVKALHGDILARFEQEFIERRGSRPTEEETNFLALDSQLNAQGIAHYIKKKKEAE